MEYLAQYQPQILSYQEAILQFPQFENIQIANWTYDDDDYLFLGWNTDTGNNGFIWDDLLVFIVTKESGTWKVIAF